MMPHFTQTHQWVRGLSVDSLPLKLCVRSKEHPNSNVVFILWLYVGAQYCLIPVKLCDGSEVLRSNVWIPKYECDVKSKYHIYDAWLCVGREALKSRFSNLTSLPRHKRIWTWGSPYIIPAKIGYPWICIITWPSVGVYKVSSWIFEIIYVIGTNFTKKAIF